MWQWTNASIPLVRDENELRRITRRCTSRQFSQSSASMRIRSPSSQTTSSYWWLKPQLHAGLMVKVAWMISGALVELKHRFWENTTAPLYHTDHVFYLPHCFSSLFVHKYEWMAWYKICHGFGCLNCEIKIESRFLCRTLIICCARLRLSSNASYCTENPRNSTSRWTRWPKSNVYLSHQRLPVYLSLGCIQLGSMFFIIHLEVMKDSHHALVLF